MSNPGESLHGLEVEIELDAVKAVEDAIAPDTGRGHA